MRHRPLMPLDQSPTEFGTDGLESQTEGLPTPKASGDETSPITSLPIV